MQTMPVRETNKAWLTQEVGTRQHLDSV